MNKNGKKYLVKRLPENLSLKEDNKIIWEKLKGMELVENVSGRASSQYTILKLGWTNTALWGFFYCEDNYIFSTISEHDHKDIWKENVVEIFIDPLGLRQIYYELLVNTSNISLEGIVHLADGRKGIGSKKGIQCLTEWDPKSFRHKVTGKGKFNKSNDTDLFWNVEFCISFSEFFVNMQKTPKRGDIWFFNAFRVDSNTDSRELYAVNPTFLPDFHVSERFIKMEFYE